MEGFGISVIDAWDLFDDWCLRFEILFIDKERLIIRRPVSILGITDAYDWSYLSPFFHSPEHECPGFDYGNQRVYFGQGLGKQSSQQLVQSLNERYFDFADEDY